ncbi:calcium/sodium antiporter [archaeon]|jgi:cation:H+ antiporter|nr:calcium/sodium antiporter [archaeon]
MIQNILLFILGIILLIKGSDIFIKQTSKFARKIGVSDLIIGLTLVAIGTSIPELITSIIASTKNQSEIILGNIIGSNIANLGLIGGIIAIFMVTKTKQEIKTRDVLIMIFASMIFYLFMLDRVITSIEGGVFLLLYLAYIIFLLEVKRGEKDKRTFQQFLAFFLKFKYVHSVIKKIKNKKESKKIISKKEITLNLLLIILSGIVIYIGARLLVEQTIYFGDYLGISKNILGLTIIALGTSLPELGISISAAKNNLGNIALGNIIGSNISNILLVIGTSSLINNIMVDKLTIYYSGIFMLLISLIFWFLMRTKYKLGKKEGIILIFAYILFLASLVIIK